MKHARLSASESHRWIPCPGSVRMCADIPRVPSAAATEGTKVHAAGEKILRGEKIRGGDNIEFMDGPERKNMVVTPEEITNVSVYTDLVQNIRKEIRGKIYLEQFVTLDHIHENMGGTSDAIVVSQVKKKLVIGDYKNGFTPVLAVDPEWSRETGPVPPRYVNTQLLIYAAGALYKFGEDKFKEVEVYIIQPRCMEVPDVQSVLLNPAELKDWTENDLWEAAHATDAPDAPLHAGEHCRFCPAMAVCPEFPKAAGQMASADFTSAVQQMLPDPALLTHEQRRNILKWARPIDAWLRSIEEYAFEEMRRGVKYPGFKLVRKRANRAWPTEDETKLLRMLKAEGVNARAADLYADPKLASPAQLEKKGKEWKKAIAEIAVKPDSDLTLATEGDKRDEVKPGGDFAGFADEDMFS